MYFILVRNWTTGIQFPSRVECFCSPPCPSNGYGRGGGGGSFHGDKRSRSLNLTVRRVRPAKYASTFPHIFMVRCLMKHRDMQWCSAGLQAGQSVVRVPAEAGNFSLLHRVPTGSEVHPSLYPMSTRGYFPEGKAAGP
jgi:hypothetical protein